jgi:hypothetical protein
MHPILQIQGIHDFCSGQLTTDEGNQPPNLRGDLRGNLVPAWSRLLAAPLPEDERLSGVDEGVGEAAEGLSSDGV